MKSATTNGWKRYLDDIETMKRKTTSYTTKIFNIVFSNGNASISNV